MMDEALFHLVNAWSRSPVVAAVATALSSRWVLAIVGLPVLARLWKRRRIGAIVVLVAAIGMSDLVAARVLKPMVGRERPCRALVGVVVPDGCGPGKSFPSGHAAVGFAFATTAGPFFRFGWPILLSVAAAVALSRVVLGVHYPSDVVAGALFGGFVGWVAALSLARIERRSGGVRKSSPRPEAR